MKASRAIVTLYSLSQRVQRKIDVRTALPSIAILLMAAAGSLPANGFAQDAQRDNPPQNSAVGVPKPPIDITADQQEAFQDEQRVVYSGHVQSIQGQDRLRTPQLTILYFKKDPAAHVPNAPVATGSAGAEVGKIKQMDAEGPVFFNDATQNATGDHGTYVAADDTITLTGHVVLMQGEDVSIGEKLVIQEDTHHATLYSGAASTRVRSVFHQEDQPKGGESPQPTPINPPKL